MGLLRQLFFRIDIIVLSAMVTMRDVGIYAAGYKLLELFVKIPALITRVFAPTLFEAAAEKGSDDYRKLAALLMKSSALVGLGASLFAFFLGPWLVITLFGKSFADAGRILLVLSPCFFLRMLNSAIENILTTSSLHIQRTTALGIAVMANLVMNVALILRFGAMGAAIATVAGMVLMLVLYWYAIRNIQKASIRGGTITIPLAAGIAAATAGIYLAEEPLLRLLIGIIVCLFVLWVFRYVRRDEISTVLGKLGTSSLSNPS
jgi:O-antigen/teichoic acid export membrane protein